MDTSFRGRPVQTKLQNGPFLTRITVVTKKFSLSPIQFPGEYLRGCLIGIKSFQSWTTISRFSPRLMKEVVAPLTQNKKVCSFSLREKKKRSSGSRKLQFSVLFHLLTFVSCNTESKISSTAVENCKRA